MDRMSIAYKTDTPLNWKWFNDIWNQTKCLVSGWWNNCDESHYEKVEGRCNCVCYKGNDRTTLFWSYEAKK